jgi:tRNA A-37 threonylcarbamoyl transferase component Bud32
VARFQINPKYVELCDGLGLRAPTDFLALPGVVISGHPNRHVMRVMLHNGANELVAYLKREHRVLHRHRIANALAGFGYVSNSVREATTLRAAATAGIGCPEFIAAGEDGRGRAFLLVRELADFVDIRTFLQESDANPEKRNQFACKLGVVLADMHEKGFSQPDLYSKHLLVHPGHERICIIDWQRSRRGEVPLRDRCRDLAALHATVADNLAGPRMRLLCLRAYLKRSRTSAGQRRMSLVARKIAHISEVLRESRRIREMRHVAAEHSPQLVWLDGEALCVTPEFQKELQLHTSTWLRNWNGSNSKPPHRQFDADWVGRSEYRPIRSLWNWLRGTRPSAPETLQAGLIFRLQRYGIATPRLLAFGQRQFVTGRAASFLLTRPHSKGMRLERWLREMHRSSVWTAQRKERWQVIRATGNLIRKLHDAGCRVKARTPPNDLAFTVHRGPTGELSVGLDHVKNIETCRRMNLRRRVSDLSRLHRLASECGLSRSDLLRFALAYAGESSFAVRDLFHVGRRRAWSHTVRGRG